VDAAYDRVCTCLPEIQAAYPSEAADNEGW